MRSTSMRPSGLFPGPATRIPTDLVTRSPRRPPLFRDLQNVVDRYARAQAADTHLVIHFPLIDETENRGTSPRRPGTILPPESLVRTRAKMAHPGINGNLARSTA